MNQVIREAASGVENGWLVGLVTALFMAVFLVVMAWLLSRRARPGLDEAARLPLQTDEEEE